MKRSKLMEETRLVVTEEEAERKREALYKDFGQVNIPQLPYSIQSEHLF